MRRIAAMLLILVPTPAARAGWLNEWGRHLGIGWSDGYHAFDQCPPRRGACCAIPPAGYLPAGPITVPGMETESAPTPASPQSHPLPVPRTTARRPSQMAVPQPPIPLLR